MKISQVNSFQNFGKLKKNNKNKTQVSAKPSYEKIEYNDKLEQEAIKMNTRASMAIAAALLAGAVGSGAYLYSIKRPVNTPEVSRIPADIADSSIVDFPSEIETEIFYVDNNYGKENKTNPADIVEVEPAIEEGKVEDKSAEVQVEVPHEAKSSKETKQPFKNESVKKEENVEHIEDSEVIYEPEESEVVYEPEDVEYIFEPENSVPNYMGDYLNPEIGIPPQFIPPYVWNPDISDGNSGEEAILEFKSPFDGKTIKETGRDDVAGSVLFDDGSILVEKSGILYASNGTYVDFNEYMQEGEGMPIPIHVSTYNTDSFVFEDIKIGDETFYPVGMTEEGNVKFNDGSEVDVKTGLVTRTNGSVYHYVTGDMLRGPVNDSEIVIDNDKPRYPYPAFPPFYDPITGEEHKEVERTKTSIIYDDGSVFDIVTGKTTRPDGSVWGYGPVLLQVPEDPSGLAPYKDEDDNAHYAVECDVKNNTATFDDESKFFVEAGLLVKADGSYWSWNGCTTTLPERLPQVEPVPGDPLPPPTREP